MRAWIVRETGEKREPRGGESYLIDGSLFATLPNSWVSHIERPILSVTPLPTREEMHKEFLNWFKKNLIFDYHSEVWLACYDFITGHKEETKPVGEMTKQERRRWIYG